MVMVMAFLDLTGISGMSGGLGTVDLSGFDGDFRNVTGRRCSLFQKCGCVLAFSLVWWQFSKIRAFSWNFSD